MLQGDVFFLHGITCMLVNTGILQHGKLELLPNGSIYVLAPYERIYEGVKQWLKWEIEQEIRSKELGGMANEEYRRIVDYRDRIITTDEEERLVESGEMMEEDALILSMPWWDWEKLYIFASELTEKFFIDSVTYSSFRFVTEEGSFYSDKIYSIGNTKEFCGEEIESNFVERKKLQEEVDVKLKVTL